MNNIQKQIEELASHQLEGNVAELLVANTEGFTSEETIQFMEDVTRYGCISGCVSGLITYSETYSFYDECYDAIEELRVNEEIVIPFDQDLKNYLAWYAFESVTNYFLNTIDLDEEEEA